MTQRVRTMGAPSQTLVRTDVWSYDYTNTNPANIVTSYSYPGSCDYTIMTDETHPNFFERLKKGEFINSPMSRIHTIRDVPDGHACAYVTPPSHSVYWSRTGTANWTQVLLTSRGGPVYTSPVASVKTADTLLMLAVSRVDPSEYHFMEDVLSIKQTFKSVVDGCFDLVHIVKRARTPQYNSKPTFGGLVGTATDAWLKYRFEFIPTYNSIVDLLDSLEKHWKKLRKGVLLRATAKDFGSGNISGSFWNTVHSELYNVQHFARLERKAIIYYRLTNDRGGFLQHYGLRGKDIPQGIWNIVTLSFMLDRMVDISSYIQACANALDPNITFVGGCVVDRLYQEKAVQLIQQSYDTLYSVQTGAVTEITDSVIRSIAPSVSSILDPSKLDFRPKELVDSVTKAADALALAMSFMRR